MTTEQVQSAVISVVAKQLDLNEEVVKPESRVAEDLGADSLDLAEIVMDLEDEFDITVPDEDANAIKTIADAVAYIEKNIS